MTELKIFNRLMKLYEKYTAAQGYIVCFSYQKKVYGVILDRLEKSMLQLWRESSRNGGGYKIQMVLKAAHKKALIEQAFCLGDMDILLDDTYNKGVMCEKAVYEFFGQKWRGKDNVPFYEAGDIRVRNKELQIKYEKAQLVTQKTVDRLEAKRAKEKNALAKLNALKEIENL